MRLNFVGTHFAAPNHILAHAFANDPVPSGYGIAVHADKTSFDAKGGGRLEDLLREAQITCESIDEDFFDGAAGYVSIELTLGQGMEF